MLEGDVTALNYSVHALEDIRATASTVSPRFVATAMRMAQVAQLLDQAVKFILPEHGELIDFRKVDEASLQLLKLPFPLVALEIPAPPNGALIDTGPMAETSSSRRIALVWGQNFARNCPIAPDFKQEGVYVVAIYYTDADKLWQISPVGAFLPCDTEVRAVKDGTRSEIESLTISTLRLTNAIDDKSPVLDVNYFTVLPEMRALLESSIGKPAASARLELDVRDELMTTWAFCMTVNCVNVSMGTVPAPQKLNAKRAKSGKLPFYEYKVLELPASPTMPGASAEGSGGLRQGPRMHLRRGHPRRLPNGRLTYVRAALVGSTRQGVVDKAYRLVR